MSRASASGKVLLTGGYLVLDPQYDGLVLSLSARFHSSVQHLSAPQAASAARACSSPLGGSLLPVVVHAPQRCERATVYALDADAAQPRLERRSENEDNRYVEYALAMSVMAARASLPAKRFAAALGRGLFVRLRGDTQFYTSERVAAGGDEAALDAALRAAPDSKTGLGSSAALVSSVVAAAMAHFGLVRAGDAPGDRARVFAHNVAQAAHCAAQGKVGSGFDVSAAFFGSQKYRRFAPERLAEVLERHAAGTLDAAALEASLRPSATWTNRADRFSLPPGVVLVLADVRGGSETPSMVRKILAWRRERPDEALEVWTRLSEGNRRVEMLLNGLSDAARASPRAYRRALAACAATRAAAWAASSDAVARRMVQVRAAFADVRGLLRRMGVAAGVPVEPESQTALLDHTEAQPGVLLAGVPGAGGYDAVFALALSDAVADGLDAVWRGFSGASVQRLPVQEGQGGVRLAAQPPLDDAALAAVLPAGTSSHL